MIAAYRRLFDLGHAHSVEVWREGRLVGGTYGVAIGGLFAGESMFHLERDASKVALAHMARLDHPDAEAVLTMIGRHASDKTTAKAARRAAYKASTRRAARR